MNKTNLIAFDLLDARKSDLVVDLLELLLTITFRANSVNPSKESHLESTRPPSEDVKHRRLGFGKPQWVSKWERERERATATMRLGFLEV